MSAEEEYSTDEFDGYFDDFDELDDGGYANFQAKVDPPTAMQTGDPRKGVDAAFVQHLQNTAPVRMSDFHAKLRSEQVKYGSAQTTQTKHEKAIQSEEVTIATAFTQAPDDMYSDLTQPDSNKSGALSSTEIERIVESSNMSSFLGRVTSLFESLLDRNVSRFEASKVTPQRYFRTPAYASSFISNQELPFVRELLPSVGGETILAGGGSGISLDVTAHFPSPIIAGRSVLGLCQSTYRPGTFALVYGVMPPEARQALAEGDGRLDRQQQFIDTQYADSYVICVWTELMHASSAPKSASNQDLDSPHHPSFQSTRRQAILGNAAFGNGSVSSSGSGFDSPSQHRPDSNNTSVRVHPFLCEQDTTPTYVLIAPQRPMHCAFSPQDDAFVASTPGGGLFLWNLRDPVSLYPTIFGHRTPRPSPATSEKASSGPRTLLSHPSGLRSPSATVSGRASGAEDDGLACGVLQLRVSQQGRYMKFQQGSSKNGGSNNSKGIVAGRSRSAYGRSQEESGEDNKENFATYGIATKQQNDNVPSGSDDSSNGPQSGGFLSLAQTQWTRIRYGAGLKVLANVQDDTSTSAVGGITADIDDIGSANQSANFNGPVPFQIAVLLDTGYIELWSVQFISPAALSASTHTDAPSSSFSSNATATNNTITGTSISSTSTTVATNPTTSARLSSLLVSKESLSRSNVALDYTSPLSTLTLSKVASFPLLEGIHSNGANSGASAPVVSFDVAPGDGTRYLCGTTSGQIRHVSRFGTRSTPRVFAPAFPHVKTQHSSSLAASTIISHPFVSGLFAAAFQDGSLAVYQDDRAQPLLHLSAQSILDPDLNVATPGAPVLLTWLRHRSMVLMVLYRNGYLVSWDFAVSATHPVLTVQLLNQDTGEIVVQAACSGGGRAVSSGSELSKGGVSVVMMLSSGRTLACSLPPALCVPPTAFSSISHWDAIRAERLKLARQQQILLDHNLSLFPKEYYLEAELALSNLFNVTSPFI